MAGAGGALPAALYLSLIHILRTTKEFGESTVSKILDLVENSSMKKARAENFITRFAPVSYTHLDVYKRQTLHRGRRRELGGSARRHPREHEPVGLRQ